MIVKAAAVSTIELSLKIVPISTQNISFLNISEV